MQLLADNQIKHIENRISQASLKNDSLSIDILDYICCMIEERLDLGWEYPKAEKEVFTRMGGIANSSHRTRNKHFNSK